MTCCSATFECVDTNRRSMISSALQERFLAGFGQGSGVMTHDSALGASVNETTSRKSLSLPTQAMMKVPALDRQLRFGALCRGLCNQSIFPP